MNKPLVFLFALITPVVILLSFSSCGKEKSTPPVIAFRTTNSAISYVSADTSLTHGTIFNVGVNASKTGTDEYLTYFKISRSINGGADSTILEANFLYQYFSQYYSYKVGDSGNVERYTFTVGERDGNTASVSVSITSI